MCVCVFDRWMKDRLTHRGIKHSVFGREEIPPLAATTHTSLSSKGQFRLTLRRDFKFCFHRSFNFYDERGKTVVMEQCRDMLVFFLVSVVGECGGVVSGGGGGADSVV